MYNLFAWKHASILDGFQIPMRFIMGETILLSFLKTLSCAGDQSSPK